VVWHLLLTSLPEINGRVRWMLDLLLRRGRVPLRDLELGDRRLSRRFGVVLRIHVHGRLLRLRYVGGLGISL
jgi:hypothetical protein